MWDLFPFNTVFIFGKSQKSTWTKSGPGVDTMFCEKKILHESWWVSRDIWNVWKFPDHPWNSYIVNNRFLWVTACTPERESLSTDFRPSLKRWYYFLLGNVSYTNILNIGIVSVDESTGLQQNCLHICREYDTCTILKLTHWWVIPWKSICSCVVRPA